MTKTYQPIPITAAERAFGGKAMQILPKWSDIPDEFWRNESPWARWASGWFFKGLERYPIAKEGIDLSLAMQNLGAVLSSFEPKHEHKEAGVAYLASLWFTSPDGEPIKAKTTQPA